MSDRTVFETTRTTLRMQHAGIVRTWPLERGADGRLTGETRARLQTGLCAHLRCRAWQPPRPVWVALSAGGVSLRRLRLPPTVPAERPEILRLQVEREFPLPPEALAWGEWRHPTTTPVAHGSGAETVSVAATRLEAVTEWLRLFESCGLKPRFTVGALVRHRQNGSVAGFDAELDLQPDGSELLLLDTQGPLALRFLPGMAAGIPTVAAALSAALPPGENGIRLGITTAGSSETALHLAQLASPRIRGTVLPAVEPPGSPTLQALVEQVRSGEAQVPVRLTVPTSQGKEGRRIAVPKRWVAAGVGIVLAMLAVPWLEAWWHRPALVRQLAEVRAAREQFALIDRQFSFLRHIRQEQAPYLDTVFLLARTLPTGVRFQSLSMTRAGEVQLRATLGNPQQVIDFRSLLADCGFFATVTIEEQSPAADRRQVDVRVAARWKAASDRDPVPLLAAGAEIVPAQPAARAGTSPGSAAPPVRLP